MALLQKTLGSEKAMKSYREMTDEDATEAFKAIACQAQSVGNAQRELDQLGYPYSVSISEGPEDGQGQVKLHFCAWLPSGRGISV